MNKKINLLIRAAYHYYVLASPIMSDEEYDALYDEVKKWEEENNIEDKLTDKVCLGYFEGDSTVKVKHKYPMISIEKNNEKGIISPTVVTPKLDGVALELEYINGELYRKLTRGDGEYGSDVTKIKVHGIPEKINWSGDVVIRGEVLCPTYLDYGKVHRNVVAGALGKVDINEDRELTFVAYWTDLCFNVFDTYAEELEWLRGLSFAVVPFVVLSKPTTITKDLIKHNYPTDGYVLRLNDNSTFGDRTSHHYKNQWAFKFASEAKETVIIGVDWSVSKNNVYTPVALLEPITLDDTLVSRVTLNNLDWIGERDICIGDTVLVHKAKDIIPEIKEVINRPKDRKFIHLTCCLKCGEELVMDGVRLVCLNPECNTDKIIEYFAKTIGIKGLALKSIEKLNLSHPLDLYSKPQQFFIDKLGKNGVKIYREIQDSVKRNDFIKLLCAINIPNIKSTALKKIFAEYNYFEVLGDFDKLTQIKGIGDITARSIVEWYESFIVEYKALYEAVGFTFIPPKIEKEEKFIAVTGTLPMTRSEFTRMMAEKGITVKSLTKKTLLLVVGEKPGQGNLNKADKYGIKKVEYHTFIKDMGL